MLIPEIPEDDFSKRRLADIRSEIRARLITVTANMSQESRDELLDQMALMEFNRERRTLVRVPRTPRSESEPHTVPPEGEQPPTDKITATLE